MSASSSRRVFIVDDESVIALTLALILNHQGYDAQSFTSPLEALQAARTSTPDLLVSDVLMPQLSGIDLAIAIQKLCPDCKMLLFSGQAATADLLERARVDGYDFELLAKPVHPMALLSKLQSMTATSPQQPCIHEMRPGL